MNNEREGFDKFSVHGEIFDICKSERGEFYRVVDVDKHIAELEAQVEQEAKHYEELQLLIGVCECIAGRGDPPADCSAPQCLNVKKGIERMKQTNRELVEALKKYGRHGRECKYSVMMRHEPCVCGLGDAIRRLGVSHG